MTTLCFCFVLFDLKSCFEILLGMHISVYVYLHNGMCTLYLLFESSTVCL